MAVSEALKMQGRLLVCATPIGNMGDITLRVLDALRDADLIAAEDTRNSRRILSRYDIHTPMTSYHEHNRFEKAEELVLKMRSGETIALITDAGTPCVSDPGEVLIGRCIEEGIEVTSLPGPSALITALTLSGFSAERFVFEGFLPPRKKKKERTAALGRLRDERGTIILYEAPHHLRQTLADLALTLGGERRVALCRELTKLHEEVVRTTLAEAQEHEPRGEYVLVIEGLRSEAEDSTKSVEKGDLAVLTESYVAQGMEEKEAMRRVAAERGISRRDVYNAVKR